MAARVTVYSDRARQEARKATFRDRVRIARDAADDARSTAPVYTGAYRDGITVQTQGDRVFIVDNDEDAIYKEYGTVDTPAHAALTSAARQYGKYSGWRPKGSRSR